MLSILTQVQIARLLFLLLLRAENYRLLVRSFRNQSGQSLQDLICSD